MPEKFPPIVFVAIQGLSYRTEATEHAVAITGMADVTSWEERSYHDACLPPCYTYKNHLWMAEMS